MIEATINKAIIYKTIRTKISREHLTMSVWIITEHLEILVAVNEYEEFTIEFPGTPEKFVIWISPGTKILTDEIVFI